MQILDLDDIVIVGEGGLDILARTVLVVIAFLVLDVTGEGLMIYAMRTKNTFKVRQIKFKYDDPIIIPLLDACYCRLGLSGSSSSPALDADDTVTLRLCF